MSKYYKRQYIFSMRKRLIKKIISFSFCILFTNTSLASADVESYQNVLQGDQIITGSFSEFRHTHFHAGIDFSTNNKTGYKVFAIDKGYIYRIKIRPNGYGKALYLKLDDGNIVVYAHLNNFSKKINRIVKKQQKEKKSFYIDSYFDSHEIPIKASEIIAYSGNTGGTSPHLHLEFRNKKEEPINIFLDKNIKKSVFYKNISSLNKNEAPLIKHIALIPEDNVSFINGKNQTYIITPTKQSDTHYFLKEPLSLSGKIRIAVEAYDFVNSNKIGISQAQLNVDDTPIFETTLNSFPYSKYFKNFSTYDLHLFLRNHPRFLKLFKTAANDLKFATSYKVGDGIINTSKLSHTKAHKTTVTVHNSTYSKQSKLHFTFNISSPISLSHFTFNNETKNLQFDVSSNNNLKRILLFKTDSKETNWELIKTIMPQNNLITTPLETIQKDSLIKIIPQDIYGIDHSCRIIPILFSSLEKYRIDKINYTIDHYKDYLDITIKTPHPVISLPKVTLKANDKSFNLNIQQTESQTFKSRFQLNQITKKTEGNITIEVADCLNNKTTTSVVIAICPILPKDGGIIASQDTNFIFSLPKHTIYSPCYPMVKKEETNSPPLNKHQQKELHFASSVYTVTPPDEISNKFTIEIKNADQLQRVGLFSFFKKKWTFIGSNKKNDFIKGKTRYFGKFALFQDSTPPKIYSIKPSNNNTIYDRLPTIKAIITDNGSGLNYYTVSLFLNGKEMLTEYNINLKSVIYKPDHELAKGTYTVTIVAEDKVGNKSSAQSVFYIK